jgi:hypothetical protein
MNQPIRPRARTLIGPEPSFGHPELLRRLDIRFARIAIRVSATATGGRNGTGGNILQKIRNQAKLAL